ncbi:MAG TPA: sigma-54 dependent transcriptional regulator [Pirellulales bacterium]|nr:sigma-54 dependent transcriptional regulator [Pirellulales bacterium]
MSKVLVVDDEANVLAAFEKLLSVQGHDVITARDAPAALQLIEHDPPDAVILDVCMPGMDGLEALSRIKQRRPRLPVIVMTGQGTVETAIEATKRGAFEYELKPFDPEAMLRLVERAVQGARLMDRQVTLGPEAVVPGHDALIGQSPLMQAVYKLIGRVAATDATVLIRGESGTGKELVARAIYQHSRRANRPLYVVNCAAIPESLLEAELFGYERGAFTGAYVQRIGKLEQADGGTLLLDEIGDISPAVQAKLLRVLQDRTLQRIGSNETIRVDVRLVSATNRNLEQAIADGRFREDLYHRLNVVTVRLPPLRERRDDVPRLTDFFLERFARELQIATPPVSDDARKRLQNYDWPGNVRELEHCVHRLLIFTGGHPIQAEDVGQALAGEEQGGPAFDADEALRGLVERFLSTQGGPGAYEQFVALIEQRLIGAALERTRGNLAKAAKLLGLPRATLYDKVQKHGLAASE